MGKGCQGAVDSVNNVYAKALIGMDVTGAFSNNCRAPNASKHLL
jgi:hypothetical protein